MVDRRNEEYETKGQTTMPRKPPPIQCTPCRVTYKQLDPPEIAGVRFQIESDGAVLRVILPNDPEMQCMTFAQVRLESSPEPESIARLVRREAARQRRNRNARERHAALKSLGLTKTPHGWE